MIKLTQAQINTLQEKLNAGDIVNFYNSLANYGDSYGRLGAAVTNNNSWQGQLANGFAAADAKKTGVNLEHNSDAWKALNKNLANEYLLAIINKNGQLPDYKAIQNIHNQVYKNANLNLDAWFPNQLLNNSDNPAALWDDWMSNDNAFDILQDSIGVLEVILGPGLEHISLSPINVTISLITSAANNKDLIIATTFTDNFISAINSMDDANYTQLINDTNPVKELLKKIYDIRTGLLAALKNLENNIALLFQDISYTAFSWGDPHLISHDGLEFDLQDPNDYLLWNSDDNFQGQIRHELLPNSQSASFNTAFATRFGPTILELYLLQKIKGRLQGTSEDDTLQADKDTQLIIGGEDKGKAQRMTSGDVIFAESNAASSSTLCYYIMGENGAPSHGGIIWANVRATAPGTIFHYDFNISKESLGFCLIPNGANLNRGLADGDQLTFKQINKIWHPMKNGTSLVSLYADAPAFYSNAALNPGHTQHEKKIGHDYYWEDMKGGGDNDYNDLKYSMPPVQEDVVIYGGDILIGGERAENFYYEVKTDGVDTIEKFNSTQDNILLGGSNLEDGSMQLIEMEGRGTFIHFNSSTKGEVNGIFIAGVKATDIRPRISFDNSTVIQRSHLSMNNDTKTNIKIGEAKVFEGGLVYRNNEIKYTFITQIGDVITAFVRDRNMDILLSLSTLRRPNTTYGLFGDKDGNHRNDLKFKNGTVIDPTRVQASIFYELTKSWQLTQNDTLFTQPRNNTSTFTNEYYLTTADFHPEQVKEAYAIAEAAGCNRSSPLFTNIAFDSLNGVNISNMKEIEGFANRRSSDTYKITVFNKPLNKESGKNLQDGILSFIKQNDITLVIATAAFLITVAAWCNRNKIKPVFNTLARRFSIWQEPQPTTQTKQQQHPCSSEYQLTTMESGFTSKI